MPLIEFKCPVCHRTSRRFFLKIELAKEAQCEVCFSLLDRMFTQISTYSTEVIDNGIMPRQVEIISGITELLHERSKNIDPSAPMDLL